MQRVEKLIPPINFYLKEIGIQPSPDQIRNWLKNKRKKNHLSVLSNLDLFISDGHENVVFPNKNDLSNYPSNLFERENKMIIVMHFGNVLLKKFVEVVTQVGVAGLDAQFCNNSLRRPLYFLCTQDPVTFRTIPGFILLLAKNDKIHLMEALGIVKDFLHSKNCCIKKFMIDKCETDGQQLKQ